MPSFFIPANPYLLKSVTTSYLFCTFKLPFLSTNPHLPFTFLANRLFSLNNSCAFNIFPSLSRYLKSFSENNNIYSLSSFTSFIVALLIVVIFFIFRLYSSIDLLVSACNMFVSLILEILSYLSSITDFPLISTTPFFESRATIK